MRRRDLPHVHLAWITTALALCPAPALAYHDERHGLLDYTAHTLNGGELRLGLFEQNIGVHRYVQVGTETLPWLAGLFLRSVTPNANLKVGLWRSRRLDLSLRGALYYAHLAAASSDANGSGALWLFPASLSSSARIVPWLSLHTEATFTWTRAGARVDADALAVQGTGLNNTLQLGAMLEARLNRIAAITLRGRIQPHASPIVIRSHSGEGEAMQLDVEAKLSGNASHPPMMAVLGLALAWKNVNLQFGIGYGNYFIPSLGVPIMKAGLVPDGAFFVRF